MGIVKIRFCRGGGGGGGGLESSLYLFQSQHSSKVVNSWLFS